MTSTPLRTFPDLLRDDALADLAEGLVRACVDGLTLGELASKLKDGRPAVLAHLKVKGVDKVGDRQKITNALAKAERAERVRPYLDEKSALGSGLAAGTLVPYPHAQHPASWLANATALKERGNAAFKLTALEPAIDLYSDAVVAASEAAKDRGTKAAADALLVSLHSNTAACYLKLERWAEVVNSATSAIDLDGANAKAHYRRGIAYKQLEKRSDARRDLVACIKLDVKNRDARAALATLDAEAAAQKAAFSAAFKKEIARDESADAQASAAAAAEAAATRQRLAHEARQRAKRDGIDLEAIDRLHETLRGEGVDVSDAAALNAALRDRGADPDDGDQGLVEFARAYTEEHPTYFGSVDWGAADSTAQEPEVTMPRVIDLSESADAADISTDSMYTMSSWGLGKG